MITLVVSHKSRFVWVRRAYVLHLCTLRTGIRRETGSLVPFPILLTLRCPLSFAETLIRCSTLIWIVFTLDPIRGKHRKRTLSDEESSSCEGLLTMEECGLALRGMASGKTPGSDGFPVEFYTTFWDTFWDLVRTLNFAYVHGRLSISQCRGLIILLFKKGDRLQTKNWRPISLLNIDYKFATWTMAGRLLAVIASVVSPDQTCGVPRYTISEIFALFRDTIAYAEMENQPVAFLSLDQETGPYLKIRRQYNVNILYILKCELLIKGRNEKYQ